MVPLSRRLHHNTATVHMHSLLGGQRQATKVKLVVGNILKEIQMLFSILRLPQLEMHKILVMLITQVE